MAPHPPHPPSSSNSTSAPPSRAFVRQCEFFERYGSCRFGEQCFYAHDGEITLGVRNAMQMAQSIGKGGKPGGGVEIRFDERDNQVKMVRVVEPSADAATTRSPSPPLSYRSAGFSERFRGYSHPGRGGRGAFGHGGGRGPAMFGDGFGGRHFAGRGRRPFGHRGPMYFE